jgi:hypothetical protein
MLLIVSDSASQLYKRSLEAPGPPAYFLKNLQSTTEQELPKYHKQYDVEARWSECAWHTATEKGLIHRLIDRLISRHNSVSKFFQDACPNLKGSQYLQNY